MNPLLRAVFTEVPVRFVFWDGSELGPEPVSGRVVVRSSTALQQLIYSPDELGLARAFITGEIELDGDLFSLLRALHAAAKGPRRLGPRAVAEVLWVAFRLGAIGSRPPRPLEEARPRGRRHSRARDAAVISHHYDVDEEFYRMVLGPSMTYSCARFASPGMTLEEAQASKHDLVCRKLGLHERRGSRLLDIGCGWGSMAIHAAQNYDAEVVAITLSAEQAKSTTARVWNAGLERRIEVRQADYRDLGGERFNAISSIGMFEHVGSERMDEYFQTIARLLTPTGRLLNHAISTPGGSKMHGRRFINRYVFPDGELIDVGEVVLAMERAGLEVRDVESLREHYSETLHAWVGNLENAWDRAIKIVGLPRARIWQLYMAASANGFDDGGLAVHQVLAVAPGSGGASAMPRTRAGVL